jgi:hypothetical protein
MTVGRSVIRSRGFEGDSSRTRAGLRAQSAAIDVASVKSTDTSSNCDLAASAVKSRHVPP